MFKGSNITTKRWISFGIKLAVFSFALWFIYRKLFFSQDIEQIRAYFLSVFRSSDSWASLASVVLLMVCNWGLEAIKWRYLIRKVESVSFLQSFRAVFSGVTVSIYTPNRVGEYLGRVFYLNTADRIEAALITMIGSLAQLLITIVVGSLCFIPFIRLYSDIGTSSYLIYLVSFLVWVVIFLIVLAFLNTSFLTVLLKRIKPLQRFDKYLNVFSYYRTTELLVVLLLSLARYMVFTLQFFILLRAFGVDTSVLEGVVLIPLNFLAMTAIPTIALTELLIRESVALKFLGYASENTLGIATTTFTLWVVNLAVPALAGGLLIFWIRIFRKNG